jgi:hypothetical protein
MLGRIISKLLTIYNSVWRKQRELSIKFSARVPDPVDQWERRLAQTGQGRDLLLWLARRRDSFLAKFISEEEVPSEYDRGKAAAYEELCRKIQLAIEEVNQDAD